MERGLHFSSDLQAVTRTRVQPERALRHGLPLPGRRASEMRWPQPGAARAGPSRALFPLSAQWCLNHVDSRGFWTHK